MINVKFTHQLPDEPYKQTTAKKKTVECVYNGPEFLLVRQWEQTGVCLNVERMSNNKEELEASIVDDGPTYDFFVFSAKDHPWEAAYFTGFYTHGDVDNYEEMLPTGEKWVYEYKNGDGIVEHCHALNELKYDKNLKVFTQPKFIGHPINSADFWNGISLQVEYYDRVLSGDLSRLSDETIAEAREYQTFLRDLPTKYKGVDHWKIAFPKHPDLGNIQI